MEGDESWTRIWEIDRLTAMIRNPYTLFVYWEISPRSKELICRHFSASWESFPQFLRTNDVTDLSFSGENANWSRFTQTSDCADHEYVGDLSPNRVYVVDFGLLLTSEKFFTLLRSPPVQTPPIESIKTAAGPVFARLGQATPDTRGRYGSAQAAMAMPDERQFDGYSAIERQAP